MEEDVPPARSVELRCAACGYFLVEAWGVQSGLFRLFCRNRECRRQSWFLFASGRLDSSGLGDVGEAIGALEKAASLL